MVGSATLSCRQARAPTIQSMSQKAGLWEDATAFLINGSRTHLGAAANSTEGRAATKSVAVLRRLVANSPLYRSAVIVRDGLIVCSYVGVLDPPLPARPELLEFSTPGDVRLVKTPGE